MNEKHDASDMDARPRPSPGPGPRTAVVTTLIPDDLAAAIERFCREQDDFAARLAQAGGRDGVTL